MPLRRPHAAALTSASFVLLLVGLAVHAEPVECPEDAARTLGPPAPELFDPHMPQAGEAVWCEVYDARGRATREGPYSDHYPSGAPRSRARFVADRLDGEVVILHENGRVWLHTHYRAGRIHGAYTMFSPSGAPWLSAGYVDGVAEGPQTTWFEAGGKASETFYRGGVEHGLSRAWFPGGQLRQAIEICDGAFVGEHVSFHPGGGVARAGQYAACPPEAESSSCRFLGSARHGRWLEFHPAGALAAREEWRHGVPTGTWLRWDPDGGLASVTIMLDLPDTDGPPEQIANNRPRGASTPN